MAKGGLFEGLIGGAEDEDADAGSTLASADAVAATVAMDAARYDPDLAAQAAAYLRKQSALVDLQVRHFDEERRLVTGAANRKRFGDRLRNGLQLFIALAATAAALGLFAMAWDAAHDHGLIVEAFSVPPDLAQRGLTGQVVAKQVLDKLTDMQAQTETMRASNSYSNNWGDELKVEIPETGVSLGQVRQYLHLWLGHETHITGEVFRTDQGLTLTARAGEGSAKSFSGGDAEFDQLVQQAAEAVYARTQPYRYATFLENQRRMPEALAVLTGLTRSGDPLERAWARMGRGVWMAAQTGDMVAYAQEEQAALREIPGFTPALLNLQFALADQGHDQQAVGIAEDYQRAIESRPDDIAADYRQGVNAGVLMRRRDMQGDYADAIRQAEILAGSTVNKFRTVGAAALPAELVFDHNLAAARATAARLAPGDGDRIETLGLAAMEDHDPAAVDLLTKVSALEDTSGPNGHYATLRNTAPWLAIAKARFGDLAGAAALVAATPADCFLCVRARGIVAAARGDRRGAERWFAEAIRQGPDLPQAFTDRGAARLAWGDVGGALADAERAHTVSPHNADALKLWGDALVRQGRWDDALAKFDAAQKYAPAWTALRKARVLAAAHGR